MYPLARLRRQGCENNLWQQTTATDDHEYPPPPPRRLLVVRIAISNPRMGTGNFADYAFGSTSKAITFIYTIQEGDNDQALDAWNAPAHGELSVQ